jgi:hypothetical protein
MQPTITNVDARAETITVKMTGDDGRDVGRVFQFIEGVEYVDSTRRFACLDVLRCDHDVLVIEMEGQIMELKRATPASSRRRSASRPKVQSAVAAGGDRHGQSTISVEDIRHCAYRKWEIAGRPFGDGARFWLEAEQELFQLVQATA